jgi:hypothetical protein
MYHMIGILKFAIIPEILNQLVAHLLEGRGDLLPSISTCKRQDGNGSSYST